jgi:hypothetical protein
LHESQARLASFPSFFLSVSVVVFVSLAKLDVDADARLLRNFNPAMKNNGADR